MNDKKRDSIIMAGATLVILALLILFYLALSCWGM